MTRGYERNPMPALTQHIGEVAGGQVGVIAAQAGVGKSALVVHVGLDALLTGVSVLHVSLGDTVDHVRDYYDEIFGAASRAGRLRDRAGALVAAERNRMIHSYRDRKFSVDHLQKNLKMLADVAHFLPGRLLIDGLDVAVASAHIDAIAKLAADLDVPVWVAVRLGSDGTVPPELAERAAVVLKLTADHRSVKIARLQDGALMSLPLSLDPSTMLMAGESAADGSVVASSPHPGQCTLYSGGAAGAEAAFGEQAERWGAHEVNFTFDDHKQDRERGSYVLSPRELAAGDVSLVYVSRRLNRTYSEGSLIRKVLQTLWHMVSRSQQVFVVGQIQEDGTVVGGTGWSVELARMWNKSLWVYDQDVEGWSRWDGNEWVPGTPVIEAVHFTGTGTRYLTDAGRDAIQDLFQRSFGPRSL